MDEFIECIECEAKLKGQYKLIGLNAKEGFYTEKENLATQGYFPIGLGCYKKIKSHPDFYMSNGTGVANQEIQIDEFTLKQDKQELYERLQQKDEHSLNGNERVMLRILREELDK